MILVRDQKSKSFIPKVLQHALCLTIYEAKGLEFDDVILFNFFTDSQTPSQKWNLLNSLRIDEKIIEKEDFMKNYTIHDNTRQSLFDLSERPEDQTEKLFGGREEGGKVVVKTIKMSPLHDDFDFSQYSLLCNELKQLYTAITRPKSRLIIFDEEPDKREIISSFWRGLDLVEVISYNPSETKEEPKVKSGKVDNTTSPNIFQSILKKTTKAEWLAQGHRMLKHKYYEQALKCFEKAGDEQLKKKALAFAAADTATKKIANIEAERVYMNEGVYKDSTAKAKRAEERKKLKREEGEAIEELKKSAKIFVEIGMDSQAAQCLFSAKVKTNLIYMLIY